MTVPVPANYISNSIFERPTDSNTATSQTNSPDIDNVHEVYQHLRTATTAAAEDANSMRPKKKTTNHAGTQKAKTYAMPFWRYTRVKQS